MPGQFSRTEMLLGAKAMEILAHAHVAIFGIGGVGGHTAEALVRSGLGALDLIDPDRVALSNLNRQIFALHSTLGRYKVDAASERLLDINPDLNLTCHRVFYTPETADQFDFKKYDYIVDAIDTVTGKVCLAERALQAGTPIISSMGTGNRMNPAGFEVADLSETSMCPLARVMRRELKKRGIRHLKVVYSREPAITPLPDTSGEPSVRRQVPGSNAFAPAAAGMILAGEVIRDLTAGAERV